MKVASQGLLGGQYLSVSPGGSDVMMKAGSQFETTQGSIDLLSLLMQAFMGGGDDKKKEGAAAPAPATQPPASPATTP